MKLPKLGLSLGQSWKSFALYGGVFTVIGAALLWQLGSLVPGYSAPEITTYKQANLGIKALLDNPLNAPFILLVKALSYVFQNNPIVTRLAAVLIALATIVLFAILLRRWHDRRTAVIGTMLFGLSAWFLHVARLGAPEVLFFGVFALAACGYWLKTTESKLALLAGFVLSAMLLYVPGMIWFIGLGIFWQWKTIDRIFKKHLASVTMAGLGFLALLLPLGWALYKDHALIKPWLGLPHDWPAPLEMARNLLEVPLNLFVRNDGSPITWLGTAPILDVFSLTMFILGGYLYLRHIKLVRTSLFIAIFTVMALLMTLGSPITYTVIIPLMYLIIAAGTAYLLNQWLTVFPRNPIARTIGMAVMYTVVAAACFYHVTHYFVGWPGARATHDAYSIQIPKT